MSDSRHIDHEIWILPLDWFLSANKAVQQHLHTDLLSLLQLAQSGRKIAQQILLLGMFGTAYIKEASDGRRYIIFRGFSGLRPNLPGTRYLLDNPKVACFVVGSEEIIKDVGKATRVAIVAYVAIDILRECLRDHFSLARVGVNVASDIAQCLVAAGATAMAGVLATTVGAPVVAAFAIAIVVGFGVGIAVSSLDRQYHITERVRARMMALEKDRHSLVYMAEHPVETAQRAAAYGRNVAADVRDGVAEVGDDIDRAVRAAYAVDRLWSSIEEMLRYDRTVPIDLVQ